jgi:flagellar protein FliS
MSPTATAFATYASTNAATASPPEIVRMAYERILTACDRAVTHHRGHGSGWIEAFHGECVRAQAILTELITSLAVEHSDGSVSRLAAQLSGLYSFCHRQLVDANVRKDPAPLASVRDTIGVLRTAWTEGVCRS